MNKTLTAALVAAMAVGSLSAQAYEEGDWIVRVGATTVDPTGDSDKIVLPTEPPTVLKGVDVGSDTQLGLIGAYMITDDFGLELLAATPFKHEIGIKGTPITAGTVKQLPPTLSLQWYPRGGESGWQPYLGLGLNYTYFFDEDIDSELEDALGAILGAESAKLDLDNSFGFAGQVGVDFPLGEHWAINAGLWYIDIGTTAKIKTDVGTVKFDVDIDPWVYNFGIAYKF
jgi:outer membrane protein